MTAARLHRFLQTSLVLALAAAGSANAERFDERDIRGDYVFTFDGSAGTTAIAAVGRFFADGKGNLLNGTRTLVVGGAAFAQSFKCTYTVQSDGRGAADCEVTGATAESFAFVVFDGGRETFFVATTPGVVVHGNAVRQRK